MISQWKLRLRNLTNGRFLSPNSELIPKLTKHSAVLWLEFQEPGDLQIEALGLSCSDAELT